MQAISNYRYRNYRTLIPYRTLKAEIPYRTNFRLVSEALGRPIWVFYMHCKIFLDEPSGRFWLDLLSFGWGLGEVTVAFFEGVKF